MEIKEFEAKSILTPCKLPDADYVVNPYTGCAFGCTYCYASFMGRYVGKSNSDWGNYVYVKANAPQLLLKDLGKLKNKGRDKCIFFSSVTDPYQGLEAKYELTKECMEKLLEFGFRGKLSILTKSQLVLRDLDILKQFENVEVGLTITTTQDAISRYFEKKAPNVSQRLDTLKKLNGNGIKTYAFVGPLLPHFVTEEHNLDELFKTIAATGTKELYIEHINLSAYIKERLLKEMPELQKDIIDKFYNSQHKEYRQELDKLIKKLVNKYKLKLKLDSTLYHKEIS
ncbi:MAG: radical SAM protein [Patescibacteria group bacterium]